MSYNLLYDPRDNDLEAEFEYYFDHLPECEVCHSKYDPEDGEHDCKAEGMDDGPEF